MTSVPDCTTHLYTSDRTKHRGLISSKFPRGICSIKRLSLGVTVTILEPRSIALYDSVIAQLSNVDLLSLKDRNH